VDWTLKIKLILISVFWQIDKLQKNKMKTFKIKNLSKGIFSIAVVLFASLFFQSCSEKMTFVNSSVVPSAQGSVKIKKDGNNNYAIDLNTMRLAEPDRLSPPKSVYVVWMNTEQNGTKNIGQMETSSSLLNSTLKSSLKTVTTYKPTGFFITAENDGKIHQPEGVVVLKTSTVAN
jgi:hypothetical protein